MVNESLAVTSIAHPLSARLQTALFTWRARLCRSSCLVTGFFIIISSPFQNLQSLFCFSILQEWPKDKHAGRGWSEGENKHAGRGWSEGEDKHTGRGWSEGEDKHAERGWSEGGDKHAGWGWSEGEDKHAGWGCSEGEHKQAVRGWSEGEDWV